MMKRPILRRLLAALVALGATALTLPAHAAYPDKTVKIVVGFTPGGTADSVARILAVSLGSRMGQTFIVENKAGANGNLATDFVAHAPADGYTIFFTSIGHAVNPSLYKDAKYDPVKDFSPIGQVLSAPNVLVVPGSSPFNTLKDLLSYAKANPGKLTFASSGVGASVHLSGELFKDQAGVDLLHIPYKGTGSLMPDLLSGTVSMAFPNLPSALPLIKSGKLKALGVTTLKRSDAAPQIPTITEAGLPGYDMSTWYGLIGPAKLPADVVKRLNDELQAVLHDPEVRNKLLAQGVDPVSGTPQEFATFLQQEATKWASTLKRSKVTAE
jgi:tripartite-type tricarboxylate transporter receptor subunit TctC